MLAERILRYMRRLVLVLLLLFGLFGLVTPSVNAQNTNNFYFSSFEADYYISRDSENRSTLKVVETLVAQFPSYNQNHGIERAIPQEYDGHDVNLRVESVKDRAGNVWNYTTYTSNDNLILRIGDADKYVRGEQTYVISYTVQDVTRNFGNHDELYWDVREQGDQPINNLTARLHIPPDLAGSLETSKPPVCYTGRAESREQACTIHTDDATETVITFTADRRLVADENLTFIVGFSTGTFAAYVKPPLSPIWYLIGVVILLWYIIVPIVVTIRAIQYWHAYGRDPKSKGTIVPQYTPPKDVSVAIASVVLKDRMPVKAIGAQLIDLAIRGYIKLYEKDKKKYELELVKSLSDLTPEEQSVAHLWFGAGTAVRARAELDANSHTMYKRIPSIAKQAGKAALDKGYMQDVTKQEKQLATWGWVLLVLSLLTLNIPSVIAAIIVLLLAHHMPARTHAGVELRDYLHGLKMYMQIAEADRIKQLQTPGTAEKIDVSDSQQLVRLYERLLPYAMLFGIEKQWAKQFASLYEQPPDWYSGNWASFNAGVFAGSISSLSTNTTSSFSPPTSSSSSGYSSGGGFSGGGGGGGGTGGW